MEKCILVGNNTAAFGLYSDRAHVEQGIYRLIAAGFRNEDFSVLFPVGNQGPPLEKDTKGPEGATAGVGAGGAIGGTLGLLVGIGALSIPGAGPFMAAGPILATLAGISAGGAVGGLVGAVAGMGVPRFKAKRYNGRVRTGGILVSIRCDGPEWAERAKDILRQTGAQDVASAGEAISGYERPRTSTSGVSF